jgi:hypothetical protein
MEETFDSVVDYSSVAYDRAWELTTKLVDTVKGWTGLEGGNTTPLSSYTTSEWKAAALGASGAAVLLRVHALLLCC